MNLMPNCKNTKIQGSIGLGQAIACFTKLGYIVSVPLNDSQDYDLIVEIDNRLYKVQVKTVTYKNESGNYQPFIRKMCKNTKKSYVVAATDLEYDYLFITSSDLENWFIPKEKVKNIRNSFSLSERFDKYKI